MDLFHSPDFVLPPTGSVPAVLTVHDLSFLRVPQFFVPGFRDYLEAAVSRAVKRAVHILVDSHSTSRDLLEFMSVEPDRVTVVYPGVEARFRPIQDRERLEQVRARYNLPARFILGLSTLQPRKNFSGLIEAFGKLLSIQENTDLGLVIAGGQGWMYEEILSSVDCLGLQGRVHFPGFVADSDLPPLYTLASVFAFPSWYEGFGLPVLEAMACGTPVVTADNSSLPEVAGDAALMVPAERPDALCQALLQASTQEELRKGMVAAGFKQARKFTWQTAAETVLHTYKTSARQSGIFTNPSRLRSGGR
jgi:glycosyltransferase involved in cell wall biosynthesis